MTVLTQVTIDSVNIASCLRNWSAPETFGNEIGEATINVTNAIADLLDELRPGLAVSIKRGETLGTEQNVFDGEITRIQKQGAEWTISCKDLLLNLVKANVSYSYDGIAFPSTEAKGSDIVEDLIETWGGMTATVVDTGDAVTLSKFICRGTDVFSRIKVLCDLYDYQVYYDSDDLTVHFEPKGYLNNSDLHFGDSQSNVRSMPTWEFDNEQCVNSLTVRGATQEVQDELLFDGDGTGSQVFTLPKKPIVVQVWEYVGAEWVLKVPGVVGSTTTYDYTVDKENKTITASSDWSPASDTANVKVVYTNAIPVPVLVQDFSSQDKYGVFESEKFFNDIQSVDDAESRGNGWLAKYSTPFVRVTCTLAGLIDYDAGTLVRFVDTIHDEDRQLIINSVVKSWPSNGDELRLGDQEWRLAEWGHFTLERIRRLEEENQQDSDLLVQINNFTNTAVVHRRYAKVTKKTIDSDGWIWDHDTLGVFDTSSLGDPLSDEIYPPLRVVWPDQVVVETFMDTDFKDAGNTDANWDTTNKRVSMS